MGYPLLSLSLNSADRRKIREALRGLPELTGGPLSIGSLPSLSAHRGKLLSASRRGTPVHAASFIRRRAIVLESELLASAGLSHILVHEIFHFVWVRLGNPKRASYAALLGQELRAHARGEVGESAAVRKEIASHTRDYLCESFCDTAAWLYAPNKRPRHVTLAARWRARRQAWFAALAAAPLRC